MIHLSRIEFGVLREFGKGILFHKLTTLGGDSLRVFDESLDKVFGSNGSSRRKTMDDVHFDPT